MPVIPIGVEPFDIQPPITSLDDGRPSNNLLQDAQRVFHLIQDERHLTAEDLLTSIEERLGQPAATEECHQHRSLFHGKKERAANRVRETALFEITQVKELLQARAAEVDKLKNRCRLFRKARQNLNQNEEWTLASEHFGIKTFYRREKDQSLSVKLEGVIDDAPLFEQICVLKEFGLHCKWAPFCFSSQTIADLDKLDTVGWFLLGLQNFGLARDGVIRAIGCDNTLEDGSVILAGQGVCDVKPGMPDHEEGFLSNDPIIKQLDIPSVPKRRGTGRMTIRTFEAVIKLLSPSSAETRVVANIDPNISFLPASLLEFIMKHLAGVVLGKMQQAAKKIPHNPKGNPHARRMRQERDFYEKWLLPKCIRLCESKGWNMTPVPYFSLDESKEDLEQRPTHLPHMHSDNHVGLPSSTTPKATNKLRKRSESADDISEISNDSSLMSRLSRNPINQFLRREEQKAQERKAKYIEEFRRRAAERLTPRELETTENKSLSRLRQVKEQRVYSRRETNGETPNKFLDHLKSHGRLSRGVVLSSLIFLLFLALHPGHVVQSFSITFDPEGPWSRLLLLEIGMAVHLCFCSMLHFLVCGVALVYAFDTLELGSKTGKRVRDFYGENVMKVTLLCSLGIVALSMIMATKAFRAAIPWVVMAVLDWFILLLRSTLVSATNALPATVVDIFTTLTSVFWVVLSILLSWINNVSNYFAGGQSIFSAISKPFITSFDKVIKAGIEFDFKRATVSWGDDTFAYAQNMFMYSAVPVVVAVTIFHCFAVRGSHVKQAFDGLFRPQLKG